MKRQDNISENEARMRLTSLCAQAEHCSFEMEEKLRKWGVDEEVQARIMAYLIDERYIDDERYCRAYVKDKIRYGKWGRRKIEQGLFLKHIDRAVVKEVLDEVDDEEYLQVLRPLVKAKWRATKADSDYERSAKVIKYALSKGYTFDIIRQCIDGADEHDFEDGDDD